jgi:hypothetical protein
MHEILEYIYDLLPSNKRHRSNGWEYFCGECCSETEMPDKKFRANVRFDEDGFVYNCFTCHYKTGLSLGQFLSKKCEHLLRLYGATNDQIKTLKKMIKEYNEQNNEETSEKKIVYRPRNIRKIPEMYESINKSIKEKVDSPTLTKVLNYIVQRNPHLLEWTDLMWAEGQNHFLIPCYEFGEVVGYTLRSLDDYSKNKYIHYTPEGYVHNFDSLLKERKYNILCEGDLDALAVDGIGILSSEFTPERLKRILTYNNGQELIVCPDRDKAGAKLVKQILDEDLPFSVSFPNWSRGIKDVEEATRKYGRLYTIYTIIGMREKDKQKIRFEAMKWFKGESFNV